MSSSAETTYYMELQPGDKVQVWDQWLDQFGQWQFYTCTGDTEGVVGHGVKARRPISTTKQTAYEEVPGSRTTQDTVVQPHRERIAYEDLQPGDIIQEGDQWQNECGRWQPFLVLDGSRVQVRQSQRVRRPIRTTHQTTYEEVPGSRTTQDTVVQPHRERIAYEDLRVGDHIQDGDQWQNDDGRWQPFSVAPIQVRQGSRVRRPYKISAILEIGDALANAQSAATQLQNERDELRAEMDTVKGDRMNLREALAAEQRAHKCTMTSGLEACKERDEACKERDLARSEVARLSTELWARKPLEDRIASLTHELANAAVDGYNLQHERDETRAELQRLQDESDELKTALRESQAAHEVAIAERNEAERLLGEARMERDKAWSDQKAIQAYRDTALQELANAEQALSEERATHVHTRNERDRLQGLIDDLLDEPTAKQVQHMLRTWATELDWSAGCFDSVGRDEIDTIQKTLIAVIERIETKLNPEGGTDDN